jgi:hypothetical protein
MGQDGIPDYWNDWKLARSQIKLTIPLQAPYTKDLYELMDDILSNRKEGGHAR